MKYLKTLCLGLGAIGTFFISTKAFAGTRVTIEKPTLIALAKFGKLHEMGATQLQKWDPVDCKIGIQQFA